MIYANKKTNRLINEKSPYLLQHAYNPVNWFPWGKEAFDKAHTENKPIFLSIGYSTCHWCHVMERESFEDIEVAEILNKHFVTIKVDREERPDVDHLYMEFCQALTGSGGWPLTILMTPDKKPFFAGTYFPKTQRYGRAGLLEILDQVASIWETDEHKLRQSAEEIVKTVKSSRNPIKNKDRLFNRELSFNMQNNSANVEDLKRWGEELLNNAFHTLSGSFDPRYGGFGKAPKFPTPHTLGFLLRYAADHPDSNAYPMMRKTLDSMYQGGIYDHIGYGFARYSTDEKWLVPHFEKMLYDNALLAYTYLESYQFKHVDQDAQTAAEIFTYILRDMTSPEGGFYSAEDADSEGVEGKFYVWTPKEIKEILGLQKAELFCRAYNITDPGNFEEKNIPNLLKGDWEKIAVSNNMTLQDLKQELVNLRKKLFLAREKRIHPHKDDKILTAWNGLMIAALAKGAQVLNKQEYLDAAQKCAAFILTRLLDQGRLYARYREQETAYPGYLDDYAFLIWGLLELYFATGKPEHLESVISLQKKQEELFYDQSAGGYFLTGSDAEVLLFRPKEIYDGALPSGNAVSLLNLLRLARLTGDVYWEKRAEQQLTFYHSAIEAYPTAYTSFLQGLQFAMHPSQELILSGTLTNPELPLMRKTFFSAFRPYATLLYQEGTISNSLLPWLTDYKLDREHVTAYLCENLTCQQPVHSPERLAQLFQ